jgi:hypothetical protein
MKNDTEILAQLEPEIKPEARSQQLEEGRSQSQPALQIPEISKKKCDKRADLPSPEWVRFRLGRFYRDHCLTDCLEILEGQGFSGSTAILMLAVLGGEG